MATVLTVYAMISAVALPIVLFIDIRKNKKQNKKKEEVKKNECNN